MNLFFVNRHKVLRFLSAPILLKSSVFICMIFSSLLQASPRTIDKAINETLPVEKISHSDIRSIETLSVYGSSRISSLDSVFTSDNVLVFPEQTVGLSRTVGDIIAQTAGVELNGQGGLLQSYNMRGFSRDRIKTEVNGIPIITDRRAGNSVSFIPAVLINNVFIQKGPSSTLYGSGAMGGVISLSTVKDENSLGFTLQPNDDHTGVANQQIQGQYSSAYVNIGGVYRQSDNDYSADNTLLNSQFEQAAFTASTNFMWRNLDVNASIIYSDGSNIGKSSSTFLLSRETIYPQDKHILSQIQLSDGNDWKLQFFQHKQDWQSDVTRLTQSTDEIIPTRRNVTDYSSQTLGALATYAIDDTKLGIEWHTRNNIHISEQEFDANNQLVWQSQLVNANENNVGVYVNHFWTLNRLTLSIGARYDHISLKQNSDNEQTVEDVSVKKDALSASISALYKVTDQTNINVEVASSFRFPTVSELLFSGETPRGNTQGNSELLSEKSRGYQLSLDHQFTSSVTGKINTYLYNVEDYIERITLDSGSQSYRNTDYVKIKGVELLASWQLSPQFNSSLSLQWQQGKNKKNETVDDGLPAAVKWSWQWEPNIMNMSDIILTNNMVYRFQKNQFGPSEIALEKTLLWNSSLQYTLSAQSQIKLSIVNIMNENYKASSDEDAPFQPKRSWNIAFTWFY